jgi:outer membrane protein
MRKREETMIFRPVVIAGIFFAVLGVCGLNTSVVNGAELKIGVMNVQKVLLESVSGKAAKGMFDNKAKELKAKFQSEENALTAMQQEIEKKSSAWSAEKKETQVREYQKKGREFQVKTEDARFELKQLQDKELEPILKTLQTVVEGYGKQNGYTVILDSKIGVLYSNSAIDVTAELTKALDQAMKK